MKVHTDAIDPLNWLGIMPGHDGRRAEPADIAPGLKAEAAPSADGATDPAEDLFALDVWAAGADAGPRLLPVEPAPGATLPDPTQDAAAWAEAVVAYVFDALG